jgi:hypothetical protein
VSDTGQVSRSEVEALVRREPVVYVRIAAVKKGEWQPVLLEMLSGPEPPHWSERTWRYDDALFVSVSVKGSDVAPWLEGGPVALGGITLDLPAADENVTWQRVRSRQRTTYETLEWPTVEYTLNGGGLARSGSVGPLIGIGAPSFFRFQSAAAWFFGVELAGRNIDNGPWVFRQQVKGGRILGVRWGATEVRIDFESERGDAIEVASDEPEPRMVAAAKVDGPQTTTFALPNGMPRNAWVLLRRGTDWLDQRFVNWGFGSEAADVEQVLEPREELQRLVSSGEGPTIEFKQIVPTKREERRKVCRAIAAFANGGGGHVLFGVDDDGQVVGLGDDQVTRDAQDAVANWIRSVVVPHVDFQIRALRDEGGRAVLDVEVGKGPLPPYGVDPGNPQYYVRRGATTFPASADEVRHLAQSTLPPDRGSMGTPFRPA